MLYPSIQDMLEISKDEKGEQRLNKYTLVMATAKCARVITNECVLAKEKERVNEKVDIKKEYLDEKAVTNAVKELKDGEYQVVFEGDEGYDESIVDVRKLEDELNGELKSIKDEEEKAKRLALETIKSNAKASAHSNKKTDDDTDDDEFDDELDQDEEELDTKDLMNATEVYEENQGMYESDEETDIGNS